MTQIEGARPHARLSLRKKGGIDSAGKERERAREGVRAREGERTEQKKSRGPPSTTGERGEEKGRKEMV